MTEIERSWQTVDLSEILAGDYVPPTPVVGQRSDSVGLFYPGKVHTVASESEGGKTWFALAAAYDEMKNENHVLFIDFEDNPEDIIGRLLTFGLPADTILRYFHYIRPTQSINTEVNLADLFDTIARYRPTLAVIDGITEAMTMHGQNPSDNRDIALFSEMLPRKLAHSGPATVCLDHVVKDADSRGRYALGGVHKLNGLDGAAYLLENRDPFGIGVKGVSTILIAKDRPGQLRKHAVRRKDGLYVFGELTIDSRDDTYAEFEIAPDADATRTSDFMPTYLMARISEALGAGPLSQRTILAEVRGKQGYKITALQLLIRDGYMSKKTPHERLKPYTEP
jgi:hypothetical protein